MVAKSSGSKTSAWSGTHCFDSLQSGVVVKLRAYGRRGGMDRRVSMPFGRALFGNARSHELGGMRPSRVSMPFGLPFFENTIVRKRQFFFGRWFTCGDARPCELTAVRFRS